LGCQTRGWTSVAFSHTGKLIVIGNVDAAAYVRSVLSARNSLILRGHEGTVTDVIFSPDDKSVLTSSWDGTARLWDVQSGREVRRFTGRSGSVGAVAISPTVDRCLGAEMMGRHGYGTHRPVRNGAAILGTRGLYAV
jgi:WD40 repeat protein